MFRKVWGNHTLTEKNTGDHTILLYDNMLYYTILGSFRVLLGLPGEMFHGVITGCFGSFISVRGFGFRLTVAFLCSFCSCVGFSTRCLLERFYLVFVWFSSRFPHLFDVKVFL